MSDCPDQEQNEMKRLVRMNQKLLIALGCASSIIFELRKLSPHLKEDTIAWFMQAVQNTVYEDKPLPPFPEK